MGEMTNAVGDGRASQRLTVSVLSTPGEPDSYCLVRHGGDWCHIEHRFADAADFMTFAAGVRELQTQPA